MKTIPNGSSHGDRGRVSETVSGLTIGPLPASRKRYVEGRQSGVRVAMREIELSPTRPRTGGVVTPNAPVGVYDTSGPYTDPAARIDIRAGLAPLRRAWILDRGDVVELPHGTSEYGRTRAADPGLAAIRFPRLGRPLRAVSGGNVSQMH